MKKYKFSTTTIYKTNEEGIIEDMGKKNVVMYKCLICGYMHEWENTWTDEKKAEVKLEVDTHHNDHIIQYE